MKAGQLAILSPATAEASRAASRSCARAGRTPITVAADDEGMTLGGYLALCLRARIQLEKSDGCTTISNRDKRRVHEARGVLGLKTGIKRGPRKNDSKSRSRSRASSQREQREARANI